MKLSYEEIPIWRHAKFIRASVQVLSAVLAVVFWFFINVSNAIETRNIPYGFGFLERSYQTPVGHSFLPYDSSDTLILQQSRTRANKGILIPDPGLIFDW